MLHRSLQILGALLLPQLITESRSDTLPPSVIYTLQTRYEDSSIAHHFNRFLDSIPDLNEDGSNDFVLMELINDSEENAVIRVVSGRDGSVLYTIPCSAGDRRGDAIKTIGDVNHDGHGDFIFKEGSDTINVHSGIDGAFLRSHDLNCAQELHIFAPGDADGDGTFDYGFGCGVGHGVDLRRVNFHSVNLFSGARGDRILQFEISIYDNSKLLNLIGLGDISQDGVPDIALSLRDWGGSKQERGLVLTISGSIADQSTVQSVDSSAVLWSQCGETEWEVLGSGLIQAGDLTNDGIEDLIATTFWNHRDLNSRNFVLLSGKDGSAVWEDYFHLTRLMARGDVVPDVDGDGVDDFVTAFAYLDRDKADSKLGLITSGSNNTIIYNLDFGRPSHRRMAVSLRNPVSAPGPSFLIQESTDERTNSPEVLHAYSFAKWMGDPIRNPNLMIRTLPHQTLVTWPAALSDVILERSSDLVNWEPITKLSSPPDTPDLDHMHQANYYEVPSQDVGQSYYRIRH